MIDKQVPPTRIRRTALLSGAAAVAAIVMASFTGCAPSNENKGCNYNEQGLSYGSDVDALPGCDSLDLIQAEATNGKLGYVYEKDLTGYVPKDPSEAAKANKINSAGYTVTVYESDGTTPVGEFVVGNAPPSTEDQ